MMKTYVLPLVLLWMLTPVSLLGQGIKFVHRDEGPTHTKLGQPINRPSKQGVDRLNAVLKFTMGNVDFRYKLLSRTDVQTELTCSEEQRAAIAAVQCREPAEVQNELLPNGKNLLNMRQEDFPEFMAKYKESYLEEIKYARDTIDKILNKDQLVRLRQIEFQWYLTHGQPRKAFAICGKNVSPEQAEAIRKETSPLFTQLHYLKQELEFEFEVEALKRLYATKRIEELVDDNTIASQAPATIEMTGVRRLVAEVDRPTRPRRIENPRRRRK